MKRHPTVLSAFCGLMISSLPVVAIAGESIFDACAVPPAPRDEATLAMLESNTRNVSSLPSGMDLYQPGFAVMQMANGAECPAASGKYCSDKLPYCCYSAAKNIYYCALDVNHCTE